MPTSGGRLTVSGPAVSAPVPEQQARVCVIGAGPSGIAAAKALRAAGLDVVVYERNPEVGGNWIFKPGSSHSSVFETTHIISSKALSQYDDFPMPPEYPDYPGHAQLKAYFQSYAAHFGLLPHIRFGAEVRSAEPLAGGGWQVTLAEGRTERFSHLCVASGHHWKPRLTSYPGQYTGELLHSHDFKSAAAYAGKRVLVIGGGNSACDIAVETGRISERTCISMRRGYWFIPKFMFGLPTDVLNLKLMRKLPRVIRQSAMKATLRLLQGRNRNYGLPEPEHGPLEAHPTINSELLYFIRHGCIFPKPDVQRWDGQRVRFVDGTAEEFDAVIAATGYETSYPYLPGAVGDYSGTEVPLYLKTFHPRLESLFFIGLVQPLGCIWPLADYQGRLVAKAIRGEWRRPTDIDAAIRREMAYPDYAFSKTPRHAVEVDYHAYKKRLSQELAGRRAY
jgi:cation diffusion facilitator CzcD-associated flavoprotein CzcO